MAYRSPALKFMNHRAVILHVCGILIDWESTIFDTFKSREEGPVRYGSVEANWQMQFPSAAYSRILELNKLIAILSCQVT
jgi:hypothetical protein